MSEVAEAVQESMFDLSGKEFNAYWVDEKAPLFIPNNPLHWKAHKLQILISRLEVQASKNPAQFNSKNYIDALNEFQNLVEQIGRKAKDENVDEGGLAQGWNEGAAREVGEGTSPSVAAGVSTDNPLAG